MQTAGQSQWTEVILTENIVNKGKDQLIFNLLTQNVKNLFIILKGQIKKNNELLPKRKKGAISLRWLK